MISDFGCTMATVFMLNLASSFLGLFSKAPTNTENAPTSNESLARQPAFKWKELEESVVSVKKAISSQAATYNWDVQRKNGVRQATSYGLSLIRAVDVVVGSFAMPPLASCFLKLFNMGQKIDEGWAQQRASKWNELEKSVGMLQRDVICRKDSEFRSIEARLDTIRRSMK